VVSLEPLAVNRYGFGDSAEKILKISAIQRMAAVKLGYICHYIVFIALVGVSEKHGFDCCCF